MGQITEKQKTFLGTLATERVVEPHQATKLAEILAGTRVTTSQEASMFITILLGAPRKPKATSPGSVPVSPWAAANAALADVDTSFYAIPAGYVSAQNIDLYGSDYLFVRIRNRGNTRYVSRVHGAPGSPRYSSMNPANSLAIANVVRDRAVEFGKLWHEHSGRCGRCNATLTDQKSRDMGFGPDCRKILGI